MSEISCTALVLALKSKSPNLTELDLSRNRNVHDHGVLHLCGFLESPSCKLLTLRSVFCSFSSMFHDKLKLTFVQHRLESFSKETGSDIGGTKSVLIEPHSHHVHINLSYRLHYSTQQMPMHFEPTLISVWAHTRMFTGGLLTCSFGPSGALHCCHTFVRGLVWFC